MKRLLLILFLCCNTLLAQEAPRVLIVTAHPDDESTFAATIYKITHDLKGKVDMAIITNGEGGYKYSTLAESIYGVELTDEKVGREYLPSIRKREMLAAGKIIGVRNIYFLDQFDKEYTLNVDSVLKYQWDVGYVKTRLGEILQRGNYDYIFGLLPAPGTHGAHKSATILALEAVNSLDRSRRPVVLGGTTSTGGETRTDTFSVLPGYPITSIRSGAPSFSFDRSQKFGFRDRLDYRIVINWLIAEHKSQGTMQMGVSTGAEKENFWYFDINDPAKMPATQALFDKLAVNTYKQRQY
jgi:LmbE family N-acetylglucosaminyl deacetylase